MPMNLYNPISLHIIILNSSTNLINCLNQGLASAFLEAGCTADALLAADVTARFYRACACENTVSSCVCVSLCFPFYLALSLAHSLSLALSLALSRARARALSLCWRVLTGSAATAAIKRSSLAAVDQAAPMLCIAVDQASEALKTGNAHACMRIV